MISAEQFDQMKDGAVLINTSRGGIVNAKDLVRAVADGTIAAAGLDVLPGEPVIREEAELLRTVFQREYDLETLLADHVLLRLRNVYVTPHTAFNTIEGVGRILEVTRENIEAFCDGQPKNLVAEPEMKTEKEPA
jgi:D-lactate dehydrogenase